MASRPRWGRDGMPDAPEGVRPGSFMSNADIALHQEWSGPRHTAPVGGAEVNGVRYKRGELMPSDAVTFQQRKVIKFSEESGGSKYREVRINVPAGSDAEKIERMWAKFLEAWRVRCDESIEFAERNLFGKGNV